MASSTTRRFRSMRERCMARTSNEPRLCRGMRNIHLNDFSDRPTLPANPRDQAMGQVYLVRHGQASAGADNYDELSAVGVEQSKLLGQWLGACGQQFTQVVTGSLV